MWLITARETYISTFPLLGARTDPHISAFLPPSPFLPSCEDATAGRRHEGGGWSLQEWGDAVGQSVTELVLQRGMNCECVSVCDEWRKCGYSCVLCL